MFLQGNVINGGLVEGVEMDEPFLKSRRIGKMIPKHFSYSFTTVSK